mmetsp:Transcript_18856/g.54054  ORF Transcript_18856/g.54054 Transcript_18856/m.54054 type:complete len:200 (+) Transcript_18856:656-1255(+)
MFRSSARAGPSILLWAMSTARGKAAGPLPPSRGASVVQRSIDADPLPCTYILMYAMKSSPSSSPHKMTSRSRYGSPMVLWSMVRPPHRGGCSAIRPPMLRYSSEGGVQNSYDTKRDNHSPKLLMISPRKLPYSAPQCRHGGSAASNRSRYLAGTVCCVSTTTSHSPSSSRPSALRVSCILSPSRWLKRLYWRMASGRLR